MTQELIDFMNQWHDSKPEEGVMLKFTETFFVDKSGLFQTFTLTEGQR